MTPSIDYLLELVEYWSYKNKYEVLREYIESCLRTVDFTNYLLLNKDKEGILKAFVDRCKND